MLLFHIVNTTIAVQKKLLECMEESKTPTEVHLKGQTLRIAIGIQSAHARRIDISIILKPDLKSDHLSLSDAIASPSIPLEL